MYNYNEHYEKVMKESKAILDGAKAQYEGMAKKYNEKTLKEETGALLNITNNKLLEVKANFIEQAQEGLQANKNTILENRDLAQKGKTVQDRILDQLQQANTIQQLESQLILANSVNDIMEILDNITDPTVFNVVQGKAYMLAPEKETKLAIRSKKFKDPEIAEIDNAMAQVQYMSRDFLSPILPLGVDSMETYVTGINISDYYFGGVK